MLWLGPFSPGELYVSGEGFRDIYPGGTIAVSATDATGCMAADPSWWGATVDGGSASSAFTDNLDGGNARSEAVAAFAGGPS